MKPANLIMNNDGFKFFGNAHYIVVSIEDEMLLLSFYWDFFCYSSRMMVLEI